MCKFCEYEILIGRSDINFGTLGIATVPVSIWKEPYPCLYIDIVNNGKSIHNMNCKINYCPMCGRKLEAADG